MTPSETPKIPALTEYKGFTIAEIYQSADGKGNHDYLISSESNPQGEVKMATNIKRLKEYIDTKFK